MQRRLTRSRFLPSAIIGVGLLVFAGIGGFADTGSVTYNGCENLATGVIRLLPSSLPAPYNTTCNTTTTNKYLKEQTISWNQLGPQGPAGQIGQTGPQGLQGPKGDTGPTGASGQTGQTGPQGLQGPKGDAGPAGSNGNTVLNGSAAPSSSVGATGDFYVDTSANVLYGPKSPGGWPAAGVSLVGPHGPAGAQGPAGSQGPKGDPGAAGLNWKGSWSSTVSYGVNDAVVYSGSSYISIAANSNTVPTDATNWQLIAQKGDPGTGGGGLNGIQEFTVSGSWTAPAGVTRIQFVAVGGGGAGGTNASTQFCYISCNSVTYWGGGGGGGAFVDAFLSVTPGTTYTITVGAGGITYSAGGASSISTASSQLASAGGGAPGSNASTTGGGVGGAGGAASGPAGILRSGHDGGSDCVDNVSCSRGGNSGGQPGGIVPTVGAGPGNGGADTGDGTAGYVVLEW